MIHILFNPLSANGEGEQRARVLTEKFPGALFDDLTKLSSVQAFFDALTEDDQLILAGGDGTINRLINSIEDREYPFPILYFPAGSGNDFFNDVKDNAKDGMILLNPYLHDLPTVTVNGETHRFLNGVGYGIDGYCCEVGDRMKEETLGKKINYAGIAIKGLLFHYKPANAKITVDGVTKKYRKVWLAPTMNGRFYGGGMDVAPAQDRLNAERKISLVTLFGSGKIKTLVVFPSIFKGEHVKHGEMVNVLEGKHIEVEFDRPCALQIDGETILGVTRYEACAGAKNPANACAVEPALAAAR